MVLSPPVLAAGRELQGSLKKCNTYLRSLMNEFMRYALLGLLLLLAGNLDAQIPKPRLSGFYVQWGYNRDRYTRSDLHFSKAGEYDFTIHKAKARDQPDFSAFRDAPLDITIPQNSYRIGAYLNKEHTWAIEINFDHAKYVVTEPQTLRVTGQIYGQPIDQDSSITRKFVHLEHTDGANFYHVNYVRQHMLLHTRKTNRVLASVLGKIGAGIVVPRSEVELFGKKLNNKYNVAGYVISLEAGTRFYPFKNFFLEANVKAGFANYLNALAVEGGKLRHHFGYVEVIGLIGYDINLPMGKKKTGS